MGILAALNHLLNFAAPALALAVLMPLLARLLVPRTAARLSWAAQTGVHFVACLVVLVAGLWWWERDGKMATYSVMVLVCASMQWWMQRGWRNN